MRVIPVAMAVCAALCASCIPLGVTPDTTTVVWQEGDSRIERRQFKQHAIAVVSVEGPFEKFYTRGHEYWLVENGAATHLRHVRETVSFDKRGFSDRYYLKEVAGDSAAQRWVLIAGHIVNRDRADIYLTLFDREQVVTQVTLPKCHRVPGRFRPDEFYRMSHYSLTYEPEARAIAFENDEGAGHVDLRTGAVRLNARQVEGGSG